MFFIFCVLYLLTAGVVNANAITTQDHYQRVGNAVGSVYASIGQVLNKQTYNYEQLKQVGRDANSAISSLRQEVSSYDWNALLGASAADIYRSQLDVYIGNLEGANGEVRQLASSVKSAVNKAVVRADSDSSVDLSGDASDTASSLFPVPSDVFTDATDSYYPAPTATITSVSSEPTEPAKSASAQSKSESKAESRSDKNESKSESRELKSESRASSRAEAAATRTGTETTTTTSNLRTSTSTATDTSTTRSRNGARGVAINGGAAVAAVIGVLM